MNIKKKPISRIAELIFCLAVITACAIHIIDSKNFKNEYFIAFSKIDCESAENEDFKRIALDDILNYESEFSKYNQYQYYKGLNKSEQTVYKAFEYALENSYPTVFIDEKILSNSKYDNADILAFLTLDSALAEQNNSYEEYIDYAVVFEGKSRIKTPLFPVIYGNVSSIDIFTDDKLKNKKLAVKKANEIISELPKGLSDTEKALEIYRYLHKNVEYIDYDETKQEENYIYDALVLGKTNCDGFANAFSLLCKLTDIPCFEKMYLPKTGEDDKEEPESTSETTLPQEETTEDKKNPAESDEKEQEPDENEGHTWNVVKLGGKWYNADTTNSTICFEADTCDTLYPFFGFSDKNQIYNHIYAELLPVCEEDLLKPDCTLKSFADDDAVSEMSKAYYKNDEKYILVYAEEKSDLYDDTMQELANTLRTSIYHESYEEYFSKLYFVHPE